MEIETVIKWLLTKISLVEKDLQQNSTDSQTRSTIFLKLFKINQPTNQLTNLTNKKKISTKRGTLPNSFYEASITPIPNPDKHTHTGTHNKTNRNQSKTTCQFHWWTQMKKILNEILITWIESHVKKIIHYNKLGFYLEAG